MNIISFILIAFILLIIYSFLSLLDGVGDIKRLDDDGYLYSGTVKKGYHTIVHHLAFRIMSGCNCSAFISKNEKNEVLTCRNYDMPHFNKNKELTSLNMVLTIKYFGKYNSINGVDAFWLNKLKVHCDKGSLDKPKLARLFLGLLPYLTMDGINDQGLTVSILSLDTKKGENPVKQNKKGQRKLCINELVRILIDNCKDVTESIKYINSINMINIFGYDYHLFISDKTGRSVVVEWRNNKTIVIEQDAVTNFYVCDDDACDCYYGEQLYEKYPGKVYTKKEYKNGYGHGYARFNKLITKLDVNKKDVNDIAEMSEKESLELLKDVAQVHDGSMTSYTQYGVIYNNTKKSATYYANQNYDKGYSFKLYL